MHHVLINHKKNGGNPGQQVSGRSCFYGSSKVFDCIPHDLLIEKLEAHGFQRTALKFIYSYLKNCR